MRARPGPASSRRVRPLRLLSALIAAAIGSLVLVAAGKPLAGERPAPVAAFVDGRVSNDLATGLDRRAVVEGTTFATLATSVATDVSAMLDEAFPESRLAAAFPAPEAGGPGLGAALELRRIQPDRLRIVVRSPDREVARAAAEGAVGPTVAAIAAGPGPAPRLVLSAVAEPGGVFVSGIPVAQAAMAALLFAAALAALLVPRLRRAAPAPLGA